MEASLFRLFNLLGSVKFLGEFLLSLLLKGGKATAKIKSAEPQSLETQRQLVWARKSLNGREKINSKKSQEREEGPLGTRF